MFSHCPVTLIVKGANKKQPVTKKINKNKNKTKNTHKKSNGKKSVSKWRKSLP